MEKLSDQVQSIIDLSAYKSNEILISYIDASKVYQELIDKGFATPKKRILPNMQEKLILRQKAGFNYINIGK